MRTMPWGSFSYPEKRTGRFDCCNRAKYCEELAVDFFDLAFHCGAAGFPAPRLSYAGAGTKATEFVHIK
jgi:hypothetical protein